jgi:hypothetical protein
MKSTYNGFLGWSISKIFFLKLNFTEKSLEKHKENLTKLRILIETYHALIVLLMMLLMHLNVLLVTIKKTLKICQKLRPPNDVLA